MNLTLVDTLLARCWCDHLSLNERTQVIMLAREIEAHCEALSSAADAVLNHLPAGEEKLSTAAMEYAQFKAGHGK